MRTPAGLVPRLVERRAQEVGDALLAPWHERGPAVLLFADLSGFTALAEQRSQRGPSGIEELAHLLNACFSPMVDRVLEAGGDIVRFAGDAPIALFRDDRESQATLVARAAECGLALQSALAEVAAREQVALAMRVTVAAGDATVAIVGGTEGRWECVVGGDVLAQVGPAQSRTAPGEVMLTPAATSAADARVDFLREADGHARVRAVAPTPRGAIAHIEVPPPAARALIPRSVLSMLDAGQARFIAERRLVSVAFIRIGGATMRDAVDIARLGDAFAALQRAVYAEEGSVNQFLGDDKGLVLVAAWGVPGRTHEDDAARATRAAMAALDALSSFGLTGSAGVATGRVFSGWRGNESRREYALIGDVMNLAARLMTAGESGLLTDASTAAASSGAPLVESGEIGLKGKSQRVRVFTPAHEPAVRAPRRQSLALRVARLVGRDEERAALVQRLLRPTGATRLVILRGEAGAGKSLLLDAIASDIDGEGSRSLRGGGGSLGSSAWSAWRPIIEQLGGLPESHRTLVDATADEAAERMREAIRGLVEEAARGDALVLLFDDAHRIDSLSLRLAREVARGVPNVSVLLAARPASEARSPELEQVAGEPDVESVLLEALDESVIGRITGAKLGVRSVPADVARLVRERSGGNPLFAGELALSLREQGVIVVEGDGCRFALDETQLRQHTFPDSVQVLALGRLDRLPPVQQLTLKSASAFGGAFSAAALREAHPSAPPPEELDAELSSMVAADLLDYAGPTVDSPFTFRSTVMREAAYALLAGAQREALHLAIARRLEREHAAALPWGVLAHHWSRTSMHARSVECLEAAGVEADASGADRETARFFEQLLEFHAEGRAGVVTLARLARWRRHIARARLRLGEDAPGGAMIRTALGELGLSLPRRAPAQVLRLVGESVRQAVHQLASPRALSPFVRGTAEEGVEAALLASHAPAVAYYEHDPLGFIVACLVSINLAEAAEARTAASEAYVAFSYISDLLGLTRLARRWSRMVAEHGTVPARHNLMITQALLAAGRGDFDACAETSARTIALAREARDWAAYEGATWMLFQAHQSRGRRADSIAAAEELRRSASMRGHRRHLVMGHVACASAYMEGGDAEAADSELALASAMIGGLDAASRITYLSARVRLTAETGPVDRLRAEAAELGTMLGGAADLPSTISRTILADAALALWDDALARAGRGTSAERAARAATRTLARELRAGARFAPFISARLARLEGEILLRESEKARQSEAFPVARASFRLAYDTATKGGLSVEAGLALERLASASDDTRERAAKFAQARDLFASLGQEAHRVRLNALVMESHSHP